MGKESQTRYPGKRCPSCYLAHLQIAAPSPGEGSRSFLGRGPSRTSHWGSFLFCLREPSAGSHFSSSFLGQDPEPPRGATRSLPVSSGRSSRQAQQLGRGHRPAGFQRGTAHPASASPPGPGDGLSLTGRVAGDSHTWFTEGTAGAGVWDAYLIFVPSLATSALQGTPAQDRTQGQILMLKSSKPKLSAPLQANPKFHAKLVIRADPAHAHALLTQDTARVAALSLSAPQQGYVEPRLESAHRSGRPRSWILPTLRQLPGRLLCALRSARQGASAVNSRVKPVTRAPQAPQTRCRTLSRFPAPSAGAYGFLLPVCVLAGSDHRSLNQLSVYSKI